MHLHLGSKQTYAPASDLKAGYNSVAFCKALDLAAHLMHGTTELVAENIALLKLND